MWTQYSTFTEALLCYPVSSDWSTHTCLAQERLLRGMIHVNVWHGVMSQSHWIKGETTDEAFEEQCFLCERGASVGVNFDILNFQDIHMNKNIYKTLKARTTILRSLIGLLYTTLNIPIGAIGVKCAKCGMYI